MINGHDPEYEYVQQNIPHRHELLITFTALEEEAFALDHANAPPAERVMQPR